jgi:hypothetical protein
MLPGFHLFSLLESTRHCDVLAVHDVIVRLFVSGKRARKRGGCALHAAWL